MLKLIIICKGHKTLWIFTILIKGLESSEKHRVKTNAYNGQTI